MLRTRPRRYEVLGLLLLAVGLAVGVVIWKANTRTTSGTIGGGDVFTEARDADACIAQAGAFTDYPLVWAGPSVLGYPLVHCAHMMTKTRYLPDGSVLHPGGDAWVFGYGTCTPGKGQESCPLPITIRTDPCAGIVDGRIIPKGSHPVRSMTVRGAKGDISRDGVLSFEQSPQIIWIDAPPHDYHGQGVEAYAAERAANAVLIAEALIPANALASPLSRGASLTTAFAAAPDTLCRNSFVPAAPATASIEKPAAATDTPEPPATPPPPSANATPAIVVGTPSLVNGKVQVTVSTTGSGLAAYSGGSIHLRWTPSVFSYSSYTTTNSVLPSPVCLTSVAKDQDGGGVILSCGATGSGQTTDAGLLATIVLTPGASGCSPLHLFTFGAADGGDTTTGTYTVDAVTTVPQIVATVDGTANVSGQPC